MMEKPETTGEGNYDITTLFLVLLLSSCFLLLKYIIRPKKHNTNRPTAHVVGKNEFV